MTTIDFIRHGEPDTTIHDDTTRPLTGLGHTQATHLARQLHQIPYLAIYSSPLQRAIDTVTPLAAAHGLAVQLDARLVERKMPSWFANPAAFTAYVDHQWRDLNFAIGAGESIVAAQRRYLGFMRDLPEAAWVAVGAHGTAMSSVLEAGAPGTGYTCWQQLRYAAIIRVRMTGGVITSCELLTD